MHDNLDEVSYGKITLERWVYSCFLQVELRVHARISEVRARDESKMHLQVAINFTCSGHLLKKRSRK